jgi:hypothetical protein
VVSTITLHTLAEPNATDRCVLADAEGPLALAKAAASCNLKTQKITQFNDKNWYMRLKH